MQNKDYLNMIRDAWFSADVAGSTTLRLLKKLKAIKNPIRTFSKQNYSGLEKRVVEAYNVMLLCQEKTLSNPTQMNSTHELEAQSKWLTLTRAEESFFYKRSRVTWFREGDSNTIYFHRMADTKFSINHIMYLFDDLGNKIESQQGIRDHCVDYFSNLLGGEQGSSLLEQSDINIFLPYICSLSQARDMELLFSDFEIKEAFHSLPKKNMWP